MFRFQQEYPPIFFGTFTKDFDENLVKGCLATSYFWTIKTMIIDLVKSGISVIFKI